VDKREAGSTGRVFAGILVTLLIIALAGVVTYLLSDINQRRYRITEDATMLVVERGRFLPFGYQPYVPKADALKLAYAPIPLPQGKSIDEPENYDDRADVDRALFALLAGWARSGLDSKDPTALKQATKYLERSELLPGLSEQQRIDLRTLRADLAYRTGKQLLNQVVETLRQALAEFQLSLEIGTSRPTNADQWIAILKQRIEAYTGRAPQAPEAVAPEPSPRLPQLAPKAEQNPDVMLPHIDPQKQPEPTPEPEGKWRL